MLFDKALRSEYHKLKARDLERNLQKLKERMALCQDDDEEKDLLESLCTGFESLGISQNDRISAEASQDVISYLRREFSSQSKDSNIYSFKYLVTSLIEKLNLM